MVNEEKLTVIPNGVDLDHWRNDRATRNAMRRELHLSDEFLWLAVGRLDPVKDHSTLLRAFAKLSTNALLVIAGEGPLKNQLRSFANDPALSDRVVFPGFQNDVLRWMRAADGFVLSSRSEGLPIALLEACACELPAVVTDIPGAREVLPESIGNPTATVGDADSLAAGMTDVMCMPEAERRALGLRMRRSVCERFSLDTVLSKWEDMYHVLLEKNPHPSRFGVATPALDRTLQLQ
jgi:glycosyltransferase involved in cell wall biosynthesis